MQTDKDDNGQRRSAFCYTENSKSQKELIEKLYQLIEYEPDKPDAETDADPIAECADYLEELQAGENDLSEEEITSRLESIKAKVAAVFSL